jgi:hypothetical protein
LPVMQQITVFVFPTTMHPEKEFKVNNYENFISKTLKICDCFLETSLLTESCLSI